MDEQRAGARRRRRRPAPRRWLCWLLFAPALFGCADDQPPPAAEARPENLLLITIDTLRADRLGAYGDAGASTPVLDELARDGVRFDQCSAPVTLTLPSHSTLLTGRYPFSTGVRVNGVHFLGEEQVTLAELFRERGFDTFAAVASFVLSRKFGLAQGFATFDDDLGREDLFHAAENQIDAERVVAKVERWLAAGPLAPFFAWVHFYDPHLPYDPPAAALARVGGDAYRGEIAHVDDAIGRILRALGERGLRRRTLVVVTADHGEAFGEHVEEGHGLLAYEETLRVPLIVAGPGVAGGRSVAPPVGLVDLTPTLIELFGLRRPAELDGRSLVPQLGGAAAAASGPYYFENLAGPELKGWAPLTGLRSDRYKLIEAPRPELYDLAADPGETTNLVQRQRPLVRSMRRELAQLLGAAGGGAEARRELSAEDRGQLAALGYAASATSPRTAGMDPKEGIVLDMAVRYGRGLLMAGDAASAAEVLDRLERENPGLELPDHALLREEIEIARGRLPAAIEALRRGLSRFPELQILRFRLAARLHETGEDEEARRLAEEILQAEPRFSQAHSLLGVIANGRGDRQGALEQFRRAAALEPGSVPVQLELAQLLAATAPAEALAIYDELLARGALDEEQEALSRFAMLRLSGGDPAGAEVLFRQALALSDDATGRMSLALVLERLGRRQEALAELERAVAAGLPAPQAQLAAQLMARWRG